MTLVQPSAQRLQLLMNFENDAEVDLDLDLDLA